MSCIIYLVGNIGTTSSLGLDEDMALTTYNLSIKLMCWMSSIDCDRVGVCSLTIYQCSDEGEVFLLVNPWQIDAR